MMSMPSQLSSSDFKITLIGSGSLGSAIARSLVAKNYHIVSIISKTLANAQSLAFQLGIKNFSDKISDIPPETNLILIAVNDSAILSVAESISHEHLAFRNIYAVHFSGALTTDALLPLARKGAITISLHPFQTFSTPKDSRNSDLFKCYFGLQTEEVEGIDIGKKIAHDLGGKIMIVQKDAKTLYHIAGVVVSNYLVTISSLASEIFAGFGLSHKDSFKVFAPIITQTMENMKASTDASESLSGPIARGDVKTIQKHLDELGEQFPHLVPVYSMLAVETVRVAVHKGSISQAEAGVLLDTIEAAVRKESETESEND
jgi:predicted short-subunit dehydrogenase-like oxidoreductase (DUF2520 family)